MSPQKKFERQARLRWVPLKDIQVSPAAQREFRQARVDRLAADFDPEQMGYPTVNRRDDGSYFMIDGQHRTSAYAQWLGEGNWDDQSIQCQLYEGMTEEEEAETFLKLNDNLAVTAFDRFRIGVCAGRTMEVDINAIVQAHKLRIARNKSTDPTKGTVRCVGTLVRLYKRSPENLGRSLRVAWYAYGQDGLEEPILEGLSLVISRFPHVNDTNFARALDFKHGLEALDRKAQEYRLRVNALRGQCVAAAAIDLYNQAQGRYRTKKLPNWWAPTNDNGDASA